ncbi:MAG: 50S ribosomal protein L6 [Bdellovibrionaceae bacterium]|nr:50S ribosomal protein L6 [Pseudobdellovibrionaceae bacterium]
MSRIGKLPVKVEDKVNVEIKDTLVTIKNGNKVQEVRVTGPIKVELKDGAIQVTRENDEPKTKALHGLYRRLIGNAMTGVSKGWSKALILNGVGYRANVAGKNLELTLGFSHPISFPIPEGIEIKVDKQTNVSITGADKALVGQVAAKIRGFRPPEPFLGKGIRYDDEVIRRKAGKSGGK